MTSFLRKLFGLNADAPTRSDPKGPAPGTVAEEGLERLNALLIQSLWKARSDNDARNNLTIIYREYVEKSGFDISTYENSNLIRLWSGSAFNFARFEELLIQTSPVEFWLIVEALVSYDFKDNLGPVDKLDSQIG